MIYYVHEELLRSAKILSVKEGRQDLRGLRGGAQTLPGGDGRLRRVRVATPAEDSAPFRWSGPHARRAVRGRALPLLALGADRGPWAEQAEGLRSGGFLREGQGPEARSRPWLATIFPETVPPHLLQCHPEANTHATDGHAPLIYLPHYSVSL